jgi:RNA polymerase sigma-70 factor, ECF subfamily
MAILIPRPTGYARLLTRDPVIAEDLVQDCLSRAVGKSTSDSQAPIYAPGRLPYCTTNRDLTRPFAKLPEEQRSAILLVGLEGMGYDEAASVAKLPVGTVRSRVSPQCCC